MTPTLLALLLFSGPQPQQPAAAKPATPAPMEYADAKRLADAHEASVTGRAHEAMLGKLKETADAAIADCSGQGLREDFTAFVVVMRLDAKGRVQQTWRQGGSPLAICLQRYVRDKTLVAPPKAPFHASLEISFGK